MIMVRRLVLFWAMTPDESQKLTSSSPSSPKLAEDEILQNKARGLRFTAAMLASLTLHLIAIGSWILLSAHLRPENTVGQQYVYVTLETAGAGSGGSRLLHLPRGAASAAQPARETAHSPKPLRHKHSRKHPASKIAKRSPSLPPLSAPPLGTKNTNLSGSNARRSGQHPSGSQSGGPGNSSGYSSGNSPVPADQVDQAPVVLSSPLPTYPEVARQRGIQGRVVLQIIIDRAGTVEHNVTVIESIPFLDESAVEAVRRWRFRPGRDRNGIPVRVLLEVPLRFALAPAE